MAKQAFKEFLNQDFDVSTMAEAIKTANLGQFLESLKVKQTMITQGKADHVWANSRWLSPKQVEGNFKLLYIFVLS